MRTPLTTNLSPLTILFFITIMLYRFCFVALSVCFFTSLVFAEDLEKPLAGNGLEWTGGAGGKSSVKIISQNPLTAEVTVGGGPEGFPGLKLHFPQAVDLRPFDRILCEVKLESDDRGLTEGGKEFACCLYDDNHRHEMLDGNPHIQQVFAKINVKAGDWQDVVVNLKPAVRGKAQYFDICLYDMPYNYPHSYKVAFRNLRLVGPDPELTFFDGISYPPQSLKTSNHDKEKTVSLKTDDGLELALAKTGAVTELRIDGKTTGKNIDRLSGILLRDAQTDRPPVMIGGTIKKSGGAFHQQAEVGNLGLKLDATYRAEKNRLIVEGCVESTRSEDRAVTVYIAFPLQSFPWKWHRGLRHSLEPFEEMKKVPQFEDSFSNYPLAVLSHSPNSGMALILDQGCPVVHRFGINPREKTFFVAFDFALLDQKNHRDEPQNKADFAVELVRTDAEWGFRSGVEKLYELHPEHFVDRVGHGGGWEIGGYRRETKNTDEERRAGGYRFDWSAVDIDKDLWQWNAKNSVVNLIYIEPDFLQFSMGDFKSPTQQETLQRMNKLAEGDESEWEKFLPLHYSRAYNCNPHPKECELKPFLSALIKSIVVSGMHDRNGEPILGLGYRPGWIGDSGFGAMIPANLAPAIPGGRGETVLKTCLGDLYDEFVANGWTVPGGFGLDCFMDVPNDYRRENFKYMDTPLSFDPETKQPMVPRGFGSIEWLKELRRRYADRNGLVMANAFGPMTFAAPALDIFGIENTMVYDPAFYRVIAGPKRPITFLPYDPPPQAKLDQHLFWGIYPGRAVSVDTLRPMIPVLDAIYEAGWQPVTGAWTKPGIVQIERFGGIDDKTAYLTLYNPSDKGGAVTVRIDPKILGARNKASIFYGKGEATKRNHIINVEMAPKETKVIRLEK